MKKYTILLGFIAFLFSCDDLFVTNLAEVELVQILPADGDSLATFSVNFWWEEIEGAENYNLQVVSGTFDNPLGLALDTSISSNMFSTVLDEDNYEWRVRAGNSATSSAYSSRVFTILGTDDLTNETLVLVMPVNNSYSNQPVQNFEWFELPQASNYLFELRDENNDLVLPIQTIQNANFSSTLNEGLHTWTVQGINSISATNQSSRVINIDTTAPSVSLIEPFDLGIMDTTSINFSWLNGTSLAPVSDSLFIFSDSLVTLVYSGLEGGESAEVLLANGEFFWFVQPFDEAGNTGTTSEVRKFTIQ